MARMEIITRAERRRRYSEAEKAALMAETEVPGCTVALIERLRRRRVADEHGIETGVGD